MNEDRTLVPAHPEDETLPNVTAEVEAQAPTLGRIEEARAKAQEAIRELPEETASPPASEPGTGRKVFVSPEYVNGKFLVKEGTTRPERLADGRVIETRDDDVMARFSGGILATDDPDVIAWCLDHPELCRDIDDPATPVWVTLTTAKLTTSTSEAAMPPELDIEKLLKGDTQQLLGRLGGELLQSAIAAKEA